MQSRWPWEKVLEIFVCESGVQRQGIENGALLCRGRTNSLLSEWRRLPARGGDDKDQQRAALSFANERLKKAFLGLRLDRWSPEVAKNDLATTVNLKNSGCQNTEGHLMRWPWKALTQPEGSACLNSKPSWTSLPCSYLHGHRIPISDFSFQWDIICHVTKLLTRFEGWLWIVINTELKTSTGSTPMDGNQLNQEGPTQCWHGPFKKCTMLFLFLLNVTTSHMLWLIYIYLFTSKDYQSPENEKYWCSNLPKPFGDCCKEPYHCPT